MQLKRPGMDDQSRNMWEGIYTYPKGTMKEVGDLGRWDAE